MLWLGLRIPRRRRHRRKSCRRSSSTGRNELATKSIRPFHSPRFSAVPIDPHAHTGPATPLPARGSRGKARSRHRSVVNSQHSSGLVQLRRLLPLRHPLLPDEVRPERPCEKPPYERTRKAVEDEEEPGFAAGGVEGRRGGREGSGGDALCKDGGGGGVVCKKVYESEENAGGRGKVKRRKRKETNPLVATSPPSLRSCRLRSCTASLRGFEKRFSWENEPQGVQEKTDLPASRNCSAASSRTAR